MNASQISWSRRDSLTSVWPAGALHVALVVAIGLAIVMPMLVWGIPSSRDLSNHFRFALPFYEALRSGDLYPGWLAESNHGFGDASFRFYPPGLYYVLAAARFLTGNWYLATVATLGLVSVIGALGMYLWSREFAPSSTSAWAAVFYSTAPYHVNQLFQALMLAEYAGAAVLPFVFLFVERVCRYRRVRDVAGLAAAYALLILTHLPLAVIGSIALALYALLRIPRHEIGRTLGTLSVSVVIGLAASSLYWTTMLAEISWIRADNVNPEPGVDYRSNFVLSTLSSDFLNVWWMNILLLFSLAMFWPAAILVVGTARRHFAQATARQSPATPIAALAIVMLLSFVMATPLSRPLWNNVRFLQETQFPWRWLSITTMASALLLALSVPFWKRIAETRKRPIVMLAAGTFAISLAFSGAHIIREARWLTPSQFEQTLTAIPGSPSVYQWLPVWTRDPLPQLESPVAVTNRKVEVVRWEPERRVFRVSAGDPQPARIRTFFYPHWSATAANTRLAVYPDRDGALLIGLPAEATDVVLEFSEPRRVKYATALTCMAWALIGGLSIKRRRATGR